jgi:lipoyl(octanoyl) transferase
MSTNKPQIEFIDAETCSYREMWDRQHQLFDELVQLKKEQKQVTHEYVILVEHLPVYTLGRHGKPQNLINAKFLESQGIECIPIERGGDITFHGPGQLVVYPIIDLNNHHLGVKQYVDLLEEAVMRLISLYGVKGAHVEGATGVWIEPGTPRERKICAIGLRCSHFITMHGIALNINTDLSYFNAINPCGFVDKGVTSLARELKVPNVDMNIVKQQFAEIFAELLNR